MKEWILILLLTIPLISAIQISEFESNPPGTDAGNEWIEFYNSDEINFDGYIIKNNDGGEITLNGSFSGYFVYQFEKQWLDNSDEKVFLYKGAELIDETNIFEDSKDNDLTWQKCEEEWVFIDNTKDKENNCEETEENAPEEEEVEEEETQKEEEETIKEEISNDEEPEKVESIIKENSSITGQEIKTIVLNPKDIKSESDKEQLNKNKLAIYTLIIFCILLVLLFGFKKRRTEKNEFK